MKIKNKKNQRKNKGKKYQFSNNHKHKLKFNNKFFQKKNVTSTKEKIIKIKNQS